VKGGSKIDTATSAGRKTPEREKLSGRQESAREIPSRRGEIVSIVIAIAPDFIEIIITIILITSTFISTITTPSRYNLELNLVKFLGETFSVLITLVVDAIEWNR
jgi:hypothetical protein